MSPAILKKQFYQPVFWLQVLVSGLLIGLLVSRALVSFCAITCIVFYYFKPKKEKIDGRFVAALLLFLLPVLISGFWSANSQAWLRAVEVKIPLLTIGVGLLYAPVSKTVYKRMAFLFLLVAVAGSMWSTAQYFLDSEAINSGYLQAKVMPTPLNNDHIRFSWFVVLAILLSLPFTINTTDGRVSKVGAIATVWLIIYLHLLAAKTGLVCLYASALVFITYQVATNKNRKHVLALLTVVIVVPLIAYRTMPSLQNRVQYILYDYANYSKGNFVPGSSDGARLLSLKAGWYILSQHPATGVGFGDIQFSVEKWHTRFNPQSFIYDKFLPLNEWLIYGCGAGIAGIACLTLAVILLLFPLIIKGVYGAIAAMVLVIPLITDDTIESQFGVVIFIFVVVWLRRYFLLFQPFANEQGLGGIDLEK